jgi:VanZ family protein
MSSQSFEKGTPVEFPFKTIAYHFLVFSSLAFFLSVSLVGKTKNRYFVLIAVLITISYGILDELHQLFVINRYCSLDDAFVDSFGIIITNLFYILIRN